jgi:hypothetical protein
MRSLTFTSIINAVKGSTDIFAAFVTTLKPQLITADRKLHLAAVELPAHRALVADVLCWRC